MRLLPSAPSRAAFPGSAPSLVTWDSTLLREDFERILAGEAVPQFCFQPIGDLRQGLVAGYEVLVRLPVRAGLPPDVCFQQAAQMGLRLPLEHLVTTQALETRRLLRTPVFLSVNLSPAYLLSDQWTDLLRRQQSLVGTVLEITESDAIADYDVLREKVADIRAKGGTVAIDDAGAGYASLVHLLELRPSIVKLDRAFVRGCDTDRAKTTMIEMMGEATGRMNAWIIAEGVETQSELGELLRLGVPLAQGFLLGRPLPTMEDLSHRARQIIRTCATREASAGDLHLHLERCPSAPSRAEAKHILENAAPGSLAVVTDEWHRPVELLECHPIQGLRTLPELLRCQLMGDVTEALQRALTRSARTRFDPLTLIDSDGRYQGVVRVDRLMHTLLDRVQHARKRPPTSVRNGAA